jgi:hypothetical protein
MGAACRVQAGVSNQQSFNRPVAHDMGINNLIHIGSRDSAVPDRLRIDHYIRPMLTLVEAAGLVGPYLALDSTQAKCGLELFLQFTFSRRVARTLRMAFRPLVGADENVFLKFGRNATSKTFCVSKETLCVPRSFQL